MIRSLPGPAAGRPLARSLWLLILLGWSLMRSVRPGLVPETA